MFVLKLSGAQNRLSLKVNILYYDFYLYYFRQDFINILESDCGEFKLNHKFTKVHALLPVGSKTNVRNACQTFSR